MIFWRIDELVSRLHTRSLSSSEGLGYIIAHLVPGMLFKFARVEGGTRTGLDVAIQIVLALVVLGGYWFAYVANGGAAGKDFVGRVLAIGWVVGLRLALLTVLAVAVVFAVAVATRAVDQEPAPNLRPILGMLMVGWTVAFFWRVAHHLKLVSRSA